MNRNVTIVVILLIFAVIAAYLVWLRGQFQQQMSAVSTEQVQTSPSPVMTPTPVATTSAKEATASVKPKTATPSSTRK